jgi:hypothetical protein
MLSNGTEKPNNKFGTKGKGTVFAQLDVLHQHFLGRTKKHQNNQGREQYQGKENPQFKPENLSLNRLDR